MTPRFLASNIEKKIGMPFIKIGNPKRRAAVSGLVRRKGQGRDHDCVVDVRHVGASGTRKEIG